MAMLHRKQGLLGDKYQNSDLFFHTLICFCTYKPNTYRYPYFQGLDGNVVCAALTTKYCMVDYETNQHTELFPITEHTHPVVKRISKVRNGTTLYQTIPCFNQSF